jgi:hypothetical protein
MIVSLSRGGKRTHRACLISPWEARPAGLAVTIHDQGLLGNCSRIRESIAKGVIVFLCSYPAQHCIRSVSVAGSSTFNGLSHRLFLMTWRQINEEREDRRVMVMTPGQHRCQCSRPSTESHDLAFDHNTCKCYILSMKLCPGPSALRVIRSCC